MLHVADYLLLSSQVPHNLLVVLHIVPCMCRQLLQKYRADNAAGRFDHGKPAAPGDAPPQVQAFMKEVRAFMREGPVASASTLAERGSPAAYREQLNAQEVQHARIVQAAQVDPGTGTGKHLQCLGQSVAYLLGHTILTMQPMHHVQV